MLARMIYRARRPHTPASVRDEVKTLERDGLLVIPDFLPESTFEQVAQRAAAFFERERTGAQQVRYGSSTLYALKHRDVPLAGEFPEFFANPRLTATMESVERRPGACEHAYKAIELLEQHDGGDHDYETDLHSDIFFSMHKAWLYLTDVTLDSPPLVYVKGSHLLSTTRLSGIYRESCTLNKGSRRITADELERSKLEETVLTCRRNTLAIANTFGYHRRLLGKPGQQRFALHVAIRDATPFRGSA